MSTTNSNSDFIYIHGLAVEAVIGVHAWEQRIKQKVTVDIDLGVNIRRASQTDNLADTVDYTAIIKRISDFAAANSFTLLETLAERIAQLILQEFKIKHLRLCLNKVAIVAEAKDVGVIIERRLSDYP